MLDRLEILEKKNLKRRIFTEFAFNLKTNNKSTGSEAQLANYLIKISCRRDYTTQCQLVNAKQKDDELNPA
jgi:hypothetical protein